MYLTRQHSTPQAAEQANESCAEQEQRRRFGRSYRRILDGQEIFTGAHVWLARYLCAKIRLIQAEIAIHLTHVVVGYVIDGEQARLASRQGHESAVVLVDDRVGETIGGVAGSGKAGGTPRRSY
jgi:hypothetical protein